MNPLSPVGRTVSTMRDVSSPLSVVDAGLVEYTDAWARQRELVAGRLEGTAPDTVLLLEHPAVYTAGKRTKPEDRPTDGTPVVDVDRGGRITWLGPGQLVGYPILRLVEPVDLVGYVRELEQILITACADLGLATRRITGRSGVWVPGDDRRPDRKVAAIGVRVARGVTMHGFALNCDPDLAAFDRIVPCGLTDAGVTSLSLELGRTVSVQDARPTVMRRLQEGLDGHIPVVADDIAPLSERVTATVPGVSWHMEGALQR